MKVTMSQKVACSAHNCRCIATVKLTLAPRMTPAGHVEHPYPIYACDYHAVHYRLYALSSQRSVQGFTIQAK